MASIRAGPIIGSSFAVGLAPAAAGCVSRVADIPAGVPEAWPKFLPQAMAWSGSRFADQPDFIHTLSEAEKHEADDALQAFKALELDGDCVSRDNFPLPTLGPRLYQIRRDVHQGKGFGVIRGLDTKKYSSKDLTVLYLGIQSYIANRHDRQDRKGNMLVHIVADNSSKLKAGHHRHSTSPINFHNEEAGDIISWLTRSTAASGGKCIIASVYTVYNVLAASRPNMIRILSRSEWPFALPRFQCRPVLFHHKGRVMINFGRVALTGNTVHPRPANLKYGSYFRVYSPLIVLLTFFISTSASAIGPNLGTVTSLESKLSTTSTFTVENSLSEYSWTTTLRDAQDSLSDIKSAFASLDNSRRPLIFENDGNLELLVGIIPLYSGDGWGKNLSRSNYQVKLQTKTTGDNPWVPGIDTVVALLSLMVTILALVPAYFTAFIAWRSYAIRKVPCQQ